MKPPKLPESLKEAEVWRALFESEGLPPVDSADWSAWLRSHPKEALRVAIGLAAVTSAVSMRSDHLPKRITEIARLVQQCILLHPSDPVAAGIAYGELKAEPDAFAGRGVRNRRRQTSPKQLREDSDPGRWDKIDAAMAEARKMKDERYARRFVCKTFNIDPAALRQHIKREKKKNEQTASSFLIFPASFKQP